MANAEVVTDLPTWPQKLALAYAGATFTFPLIGKIDDEAEEVLAKCVAGFIVWLDENATLKEEVTLPALPDASEPAEG